jgi:hypothetical protein
MDDAEMGNAGADLLGLPVSTTTTIKTVSNAEAATTFINGGSQGRKLGRFCIVGWSSILTSQLGHVQYSSLFRLSPLTV